MRPNIDDGVVLLTGASSGIGAAMARQLAPRARALALLARRAERLDALATELRTINPRLAVSIHPCDAADLAAAGRAVEAAEAAHGPIDVLVNAAGMGDVAYFDRASWEKTHAMLQLNVVALSFLTHRVLPGMIARGRGGVLNVSSGFGLTWLPLFAAYAGSKHYVSAFTESLRAELWGSGVAICHLCPGPVRTEFEEIAGNPLGRPLPGWLQIDAGACARAAIRGFERNKALIIPGLVAKALITLGRLTPHFVARLLYGPVASTLRSRLAGPPVRGGA